LLIAEYHSVKDHGHMKWWRTLIILALADCGAGPAPPPAPAPVVPSAPVPQASAAAARPVWKVGVALPLTGAREAIGGSSREGIDLALDELNAHDGAGGRRLTAVYADLGSTPRGRAERFQGLVAEGVVAILGELPTNDKRQVSPIVDLRVPVIATFEVSPAISGIAPNAFRTCFVYEREAQAGALFAVRQLNRRKIGLLFMDRFPSAHLARWFAAQAERVGARVVAAVTLGPKPSDGRHELEQLRTADADLIYAPLPPQVMRAVAHTAHELGIDSGIFFGADVWDDPQLFGDAGADGSAFEGAHFTNHFVVDAPWPRARAFVSAYQERYHHDPASPAATAYDAVLLLADALDHAPDGAPDALRAALQATKGVAGVTGEITFDADHDADKAILVVRVRRGRLTYAGSATVADPPPWAPPLRR
jgi:branched-chain amino acid transport system substrate-binding protein